MIVMRKVMTDTITKEAEMGGKSKKQKLETMCDMVSRKAGLKELKAAARGAKFICSECGRAARKKESLCRAKKL